MINANLPFRVTSLTEKALLNTFFLNALEPPECIKCKIESIDNSVLKSCALAAANNVDLYSSPLNKSYVHIGTKPIKAAIRVAYMAFVTLTISSLDLIVDGSLGLKSYLLYKVAIYNLKDPKPEWNKTKKYAEACLTDLTIFLKGALCSTCIVLGSLYSLNCFRLTTFFMGKCTLSPIESVVHGVFSGVAFFLASMFMGSMGLAFALPQMIARKDEKTGMFLALSLRNLLGLVDTNGSLLSFSNADQIQFTQKDNNITFYDESLEHLTALVIHAEIQLIDAVRRANIYLNNEKKPSIDFSYPFDGIFVANHLKQHIPNLHPNLIKELERMDQKVKILRKLHMSARMLAVGTLPIDPLTSFFDKPLPSFIKREDYKRIFRTGVPDNLPDFIIPLDPNEKASGLTLYENFKQNLRINKWYLEKGARTDLISPFALLGLEEACSHADYKEAKKQYLKSLHPDKNGSSEESKELFTYLRQQVLAKIEPIFKDKGIQNDEFNRISPRNVQHSQNRLYLC